MDAARVIVRATSVPPTITEVAAALAVTRPTVYRYFASADALLLAAASDGIDAFLDDIAARIASSRDPAEVVVEGIAFTYEEIGRRTELAQVLAPARGNGPREVTSDVAVDFGRTVLEATAVDWPAVGFPDDADVEELARFMLRILQSLLVDPGEPPLQDEALRAYLRRWVGPAVRRPLPLVPTTRRRSPRKKAEQS